MIKNNTEVKVKVKREPELDEFEEGDHVEEDQDGSDKYDNGGVLVEEKEKQVLHAGHFIRVQAM